MKRILWRKKTLRRDLARVKRSHYMRRTLKRIPRRTLKNIYKKTWLREELSSPKRTNLRGSLRILGMRVGRLRQRGMNLRVE